METLKDYTDLDPYKINENIFNLLDNKWMLITSGTKEHFNMMTASWGGMGVLWNKAVVTIFIRPQRYTYKFVEENSSFNVCFFNQEYKPALNFCGTKSGRDFDKVKEAGLNPVITPNNSITFKEAYLSIDCIKLYSDDLKSSNFIDKSLIDKIYPSKDFHRFYIGEIIGCYLL
ncbi:MAG: flavin reductase family protein [Bacteroidales bacterium]|nr:flavin reductase family protein [Bacteroidales bacterium]